ncbi:hypothetical protein OSTOST_15924, partial [Ostertagia ostertagi]
MWAKLYIIVMHYIAGFCVKVGSEVLRKEFGWKSAFFERLDMPSAYPWEYVWCFSFIPIICAMLSFSKNRARSISNGYHMVRVFFAVALQIHGFAMYFSYHLAAAWTPMKRD